MSFKGTLGGGPMMEASIKVAPDDSISWAIGFTFWGAIALPNQPSVAVHQSVGFSPIGVLRRVGYKFAQWHDVGYWQLSLQPESSFLTDGDMTTQSVNLPVSLAEIQKSPLWNKALTSGLLLLRV